MLNKDIEYVEYSGFVIPCYIYVDGSSKEEYWVDLQNAYFNFIDKEIDESTNKINGLNWWVITPHIPKNKKKINDSDVKWFVSDSSLNNDTNFEWDFEKHCAILTKSEIKKRISDFINTPDSESNSDSSQSDVAELARDNHSLKPEYPTCQPVQLPHACLFLFLPFPFPRYIHSEYIPKE